LTILIESIISFDVMKTNVSTSLEDSVINRIARVAEREMVTNSAVIRKCIVRHLPELEREILGEAFVGAQVNQSAPKKEKKSRALAV
jgi:hypothetical protein